MNTKQVMARLEELGDEKRRAFNAKRGAGDNQFGVKTGDIRGLGATHFWGGRVPGARAGNRLSQA